MSRARSIHNPKFIVSTSRSVLVIAAVVVVALLIVRHHNESVESSQPDASLASSPSQAHSVMAESPDTEVSAVPYTQPDWESNFTLMTDAAQASALAAQQSSWNDAMLSTNATEIQARTAMPANLS